MPGTLLRYASEAWCGRRDSNPQALRRSDLNRVRLPVPPRPRAGLPPPRCDCNGSAEGRRYSRGFRAPLGPFSPPRACATTTSGDSLTRRGGLENRRGLAASRFRRPQRAPRVCYPVYNLSKLSSKGRHAPQRQRQSVFSYHATSQKRPNLRPTWWKFPTCTNPALRCNTTEGSFGTVRQPMAIWTSSLARASNRVV